MTQPWKNGKKYTPRSGFYRRTKRPRKSNEEYMEEYLADREDFEMPCGTWVTIPAGTHIEPSEICPFD